MFTVDTKKLVPRFILRDKNGYALAMAIQAGLQAMNDAVEQGLELLSDFDSMPEWRLDELAWEQAIGWYDFGADVEEKRRIVRAFAESYIHLGTPLAVREAVTAILGDGWIEEWYQYGGQPYHYRLLIHPDSVSPQALARLRQRVRDAQNARSVLDTIGAQDTGGATAWAAAAAAAMEIRISARAT